MQLTITANGNRLEDVEEAVNEAMHRFMQGSTSGFDSNDDSDFTFDVEGSPEDNDDEDEPEYVEPVSYACCAHCEHAYNAESRLPDNHAVRCEVCRPTPR